MAHKKTSIRFADNVIEFSPKAGAAPSITLSAMTSGHVSRNELTSIKALTSYVAHTKSVSESLVQECLSSEFKVSDMAELRRADYQRVIKFLVDLQLDLMIN